MDILNLTPEKLAIWNEAKEEFAQSIGHPNWADYELFCKHTKVLPFKMGIAFQGVAAIFEKLLFERGYLSEKTGENEGDAGARPLG